MAITHPFSEPLRFGNEKQISTYKRMEAVKEARGALGAFPMEVVVEAIEDLGIAEREEVLVVRA